jgi:hypothetical protein
MAEKALRLQQSVEIIKVMSQDMPAISGKILENIIKLQ